MNSSLILSKLLAENKPGNLTDEQIKFAQTIYAAGNDLLNLVNDILDLSKIEAGEMDVRANIVSISRLMESVSRTFQPVAAHRKLSFTLETDSKAPESFTSDVQRLAQILNNLVSNAFKFTETGGVAVRISAGPDNTIVFAVKDTGIGISREQQQLIFDAFRQADGSTQRKFGGTGLGLSISQKLARLLGGEIFLESVVGTGSTFRLFVPREMSAGQIVRHRSRRMQILGPATKRLEPRRLHLFRVRRRSTSMMTGQSHLRCANSSVIEDDERFARLLYDLAHEVGFMCVISASAADGLALARTIRPSAAVLDMRLPDQSGLYVLDQFEKDGTVGIFLCTSSLSQITYRSRANQAPLD